MIDGRKVFGEQGAGGFNRLQCTGFPGALAKGGFQLAAEAVPFGLFDAGGDAAVGHDFDPMVDQLDIDQDAAVVRRVPHPELGEEFDRALAHLIPGKQRRHRQRTLGDEAEFTAMMLFGAADGRFDALPGGAGKMPLRQPGWGEQMMQDAF